MYRTLFLLPFAVAATGCDLELPSGDITSVHTWGQYFLDKFEDERHEFNTVIEEGPAPIARPRTVLLVTGVTIPIEWFDGIKARLERDGFNTVSYEPPELLSYDLFEASHDLADVVDDVLAETGEETIDILAECTGGVIARYYVQSLGGDRNIDRLVTFVSPQAGIDKVPLARAFVDWEALEDLTPGSEFLTEVASVPLPETVDMTSIYTCTDEYIQPYTTSIVPGATNIGLCDGFVGHFQTMYDPEIYLIMHGALIQPLSFRRDRDDDGVPDDIDDTIDDDTIEDDTEDMEWHGAPELDADTAGCSAAGGDTPIHGAFFLLALGMVSRSRRRAAR